MSEAKSVDLDALHKAKAETEGPAPQVMLGGHTFTLPRSLPAAVLVGLGRVRNEDMEGITDVLEGLFGVDTETVPGAKAAMRAGFTLDDIDVIFEEFYKEDPGEAGASAS